ncbi:hypothetical protein [Agromyces aureus]|uniref:DUF916 domain-containing protein n=1 Tax=Agromyces aureus TaxID=453304 RepID=A0A191WHZ2_9MICO|nr:hypothetical protein [Agromyces aureus]ANJ27793.1 hypothetical protein ATC03_14820 [Agromyces aureus]
MSTHRAAAPADDSTVIRRWVAAGAVAVSLLVLGYAEVGPAQAEEQADDAVTWSVGPADAVGPDGRSWVDLDVDPGESIDEFLYVKNLSSIDVVFALKAQDGYLTDKGRFNMLPSAAESIDSGTWIDLPAEIGVPAGGMAIVPFTVEVPVDATPGDHAAGIAASVLSTGAVEGGPNVAMESRVGFRVQTRVSGELSPSLAVVGNAAYQTAWNPFAPGAVEVEYTVTNNGNARLAVEAAVSASGANGTAPVLTEPTELYPGDEREFSARVSQVWPLGFSVVTVDVDGQVSRSEVSGEEPTSSRIEIVVWAMPWSQLLVIVALALFLFAILRGRRRRRTELERLLDEARLAGAREAAANPERVP